MYHNLVQTQVHTYVRTYTIETHVLCSYCNAVVLIDGSAFWYKRKGTLI